MSDLSPRAPKRPLLWPDAVLDLADMLADWPAPVYAVGGSVRDAYFGMPLHDLDLITPSDAAKLARRLANALNGDVYVMDAERDVARVLAETSHGRLAVDVAAYRAPDLLADLTERDFTINAMAVDLRDPSLLTDPLNGEFDLNQKLVRRCAPHAIETDPIRALRAVRQSIQINGHIEKSTLLDIRANAGRLYETSPERVRDEFVKLLAGQRPQAALRVAQALGLLMPILPDVAALPAERFEHTLRVVEHASSILNVISPARTDNTAAAFGLGAVVVALDRFRRELQAHIDQQWAGDRPHRALLYLASLLVPIAATVSDVPLYVEGVVAHLRLSNQERARLSALLLPDAGLIASEMPLEDLAMHRYWHTLGAAGIDAVILSLSRYLADAGVDLDRDSWIAVLERAQTLLDAYYRRHAEIVAPPPVVDGHQLMNALSLRPGPIIRELLDHIREAQVLREVVDRPSALDAAREYLRLRRS